MCRRPYLRLQVAESTPAIASHFSSPAILKFGLQFRVSSLRLLPVEVQNVSISISPALSCTNLAGDTCPPYKARGPSGSNHLALVRKRCWAKLRESDRLLSGSSA